ncbi:MAG: DUF222 domain-containing protein [Gammaproteobacteria bacterium]|nr:DUF222 domain-containing protein [Gammaproteobacteria bacterium]
MYTSSLASAHDLGNEISTLYAHINAATFTFLEKIREFDTLGLYGALNCKSTAHWLNFACGIGLVAGREKVRVAKALAELPKTQAAFREGRLSYSKARAVTRVATADNEHHFLNIAYHSTASQTERIVRNHINVMTAERDSFGKRSLTYHWLADGCLSFKGRLTADQGAMFIKSLEQAFAAHDSREMYAAVLEDHEPMEAKRADALLLISETSLAAKSVSSSTADRYQVSVHVNAEALQTSTTTLDDPPQIEGGCVIPLRTAERLTCDGSIIPILETAEAEPLKIGRKLRTVSPALRRALKRRDKGCKFPGCEQTYFVDAHHIRHWAHGGETNLENLVLLCRYHHHQLHEGGYGITGAGKGVRFMDPQGVEIPTVDDDLSCGRVEILLKAASAEAWLTAEILTPEMDWRPPDYDHIAWVLSQFA